MKTSSIFFMLCALLTIAGAMSFVGALVERTHKPDPAHDATGRYQMIPGAGGLGMFDSASGKIYYITNQEWQLIIAAPK